MRKSRLSLAEAKEKYPDSVSYTHLDVYKRQRYTMGARNKAQKGPCYALEAVFSPPRVKYRPPLYCARKAA